MFSTYSHRLPEELLHMACPCFLPLFPCIFIGFIGFRSENTKKVLTSPFLKNHSQQIVSEFPLFFLQHQLIPSTLQQGWAKLSLDT